MMICNPDLTIPSTANLYTPSVTSRWSAGFLSTMRCEKLRPQCHIASVRILCMYVCMYVCMYGGICRNSKYNLI